MISEHTYHHWWAPAAYQKNKRRWYDITALVSYSAHAHNITSTASGLDAQINTHTIQSTV